MNTHLVGMTLMPQMESQSIFVVTVRGRINSAWRTKEAAQAQCARLINHNGNQIGAAVQEIELRA